MSSKYLRTSDLARLVGIHPNTVRRYVEWGLVPPVERSPSGYRLFTPHHLDCLRLARLIYASDYPGRCLRASSREIIQCAVAGDWSAALAKAREHSVLVKTELKRADQAADLLEHWAKTRRADTDGLPLSIGEVSRRLGVSLDVLRNWERNGLITVPRDPSNGYRLFRNSEVERLEVIRMLSRAGYGHMAILRMCMELDAGKTRGLKKALDTPRPDEEIFTVANHWLSTLHAQDKLARQLVRMLKARVDRAG